MENDFDKLDFSRLNRKHHITYGVVYGREKVVLIKAGLKGSCYGYDNKYLKLAHMIRDTYGHAVVCASNPCNAGSWYSPIDGAIPQLQNAVDYCKKLFGFLPIIYVGTSNGAVMGLKGAHQYREIKNVLAINPVIPTNAMAMKRGVRKLKFTPTIVFGSKDTSIKYLKLLWDFNAHLSIVSGQDHLFSNPTGTQLNTIIMNFVGGKPCN